MDYKMDSGWKLHPIGGDTGHAYMGIRAEEKVFLKRNSSPFLAALSVEGITPRLIWTKRIGNGDVLTAQEWLNGRVLTRQEMHSKGVTDIINKIHHSDHLLSMLRKVKGEVYDPETFLEEYKLDLDESLATNSFLNTIVAYLEATLYLVKGAKYTVCHGDLNRKNFFLTDNKRLYLVDWESVKIADPMADISLLLIQYIEPEGWPEWLREYGITRTEGIDARLEWYNLMNRLLLAKRFHTTGDYHKMNQQILGMKKSYEDRFYKNL
ncbi:MULTISPECIES: phosphotransferase family protein [unclassified Jeotgalibaca]|uniref:phosphotransferase family protein n=1 Tax=unclassified Jeotgalibaca TaxID=2621505 RepID=UPI003FD60CE3